MTPAKRAADARRKTSRPSGLRPLWLACLLGVLGGELPPAPPAAAAAENVAAPGRLSLPTRQGQVFVIDDFNDKVTAAQLGVNQLSGPSGLIASALDVGSIGWSDESNGAPGGSLRLTWNFDHPPAVDGVAGVYFSLFGPSEAKISLDGHPPASVTPLPGYALDIANVFGATSPGLWTGRSVEELRLDVRPVDVGPAVVLKVELADDAGARGFAHAPVAAGAWQTLRLPLAMDAWRQPGGALDLSRLKKISLLVEQHPSAGQNPPRGQLLIDNLALVDQDGQYPDLDAARGKPGYDRAFLEHVRASSFLYFLDSASREPGCGGMIRDRASFAELMTVGGAGFQLTAYTIAAERRYLSRGQAAARSLRLLRLLDDGPQGAQRVGATGHKGFFYHFLGIDGRRKMNFDQTATPHIHESLNTVELSTIDTALAICGVLTAGRYFVGAGADETEIRRRADAIYARVDWRFMLDPQSNQFYLGWKPNEYRDNRGSLFGRYEITDADKLGQYSSRIVAHPPDKEREAPATLDYYTDEGLLIALLASAAPDPAKRVDSSAFFAMLREPRGGPFVRTWSGSLFTYQFASCWLDTNALGADRDPAGKAPRMNYFENTRAAIRACRDYAARNPRRHASLSAARFGLSACDGPFNAYFPEAAPPLSLASEPEGPSKPDGPRGLEVGTVTVYGAGSSILHAPRETIDALWECQQLGLLHPRVGFADAFNLDIADAAGGQRDLLRGKGRWVHWAGFAIDQGPMLILTDNYLEDHFTQKLFMSHPGVRRALAGLFPDWNPPGSRN